MSKIEWLHRPGTKPEVWNPVTGCTKVSEGCRNCYAEAMAKRFWRRTPEFPAGRMFTDVMVHEWRLSYPLHWTKPRTVFVNSMSDLFHKDVPDEFIDRVFAVMALARAHTFICLTKRPDRMNAYVHGARDRVALCYNAMYDKGRTGVDAPRASDRLGRPCLESCDETWPRSEERGRLREWHSGDAVCQKAGGASHSTGIPPTNADGWREASNCDGSPRRVGAGERTADTAGADDQPQERPEGLQPAVEPRTGDHVGATEARLVGVERGAYSSHRQQPPKDSPSGIRRSENAGTATGRRHGEGDRCALPNETQGRVSHLYAKDLEAHLTWPLPNVWLGVSVEDQATADQRIPILRQTPAAVRVVSYEPALGPVDLDRGGFTLLEPITSPSGVRWPGLDWVIVGGESGPKARPCDVAWIRSIVRQCQQASVPCFVKQLGARSETDSMSDLNGHEARGPRWLVLRARKGNDMAEWPEDLRVREWPEANCA